jgi:hypothetical protein
MSHVLKRDLSHKFSRTYTPVGVDTLYGSSAGRRSGSSRRWGTARRRRAAPSRPTRARTRLAHRLRRHRRERAPPHPRLQAAYKQYKQRGTADQAPFDHATGVGHVAGHAGHYADALAKGRQVVLIVIEITGAVHPDAVGMLYAISGHVYVLLCAESSLIRNYLLV